MGYAYSRPVLSPGGIQRLAQIVHSQRFEQKSIERHELLAVNRGGAHGQQQWMSSGRFHGANALGELAPGDSGHLEIDQQHIRLGRLIGGKQLQGGPGVVGAEYLMAFMSQQQSHQFKAHCIIIYQKNLVPGLDSIRPG
jgi:hypothetical protein